MQYAGTCRTVACYGLDGARIRVCLKGACCAQMKLPLKLPLNQGFQMPKALSSSPAPWPWWWLLRPWRFNAKGIVSSSPGLAVAAYPGKNVPCDTTPKVVVARMAAINLSSTTTTFGIEPVGGSNHSSSAEKIVSNSRQPKGIRFAKFPAFLYLGLMTKT
jgi:hypothetical protein